jgi:hypothetical protein
MVECNHGTHGGSALAAKHQLAVEGKEAEGGVCVKIDIDGPIVNGVNGTRENPFSFLLTSNEK